MESGSRGMTQSITPVQQMISSCSGALLTSVLVTPLDVVKIRLQAQQNQISQGRKFLYHNGLMDHVCKVNCEICGNGKGMAAAAVSPKTAWYARSCPAQFTGTFDAFIKIARYEGISSLWSGLPPTLVMAVPATVIYFTTYDQLKVLIGSRLMEPNNFYVPMLAGASARVFAAVVSSPLELVRTKMQSESISYKELGKAVRTTIRAEGWSSILKGLGPTLLRDVPFSGLYWYGYENMKALQLKKSSGSELTFLQSFIGGAVSGTFAAVITLPFDVVKTHQQIELGNGNGRRSTWKIMGELYTRKGPTALFAGLLPRLLKVAPACAIMISTYEYGKHFFGKKNQSHNKDSEKS